MRKLASKRRVKARLMIGRWVSHFDMLRHGLPVTPALYEIDWYRALVRRARAAIHEEKGTKNDDDNATD